MIGRSKMVEKKKEVVVGDYFDQEKILKALLDANNRRDKKTYDIIRDCLIDDKEDRLPISFIPYEDVTLEEIDYMLTIESKRRIEEIPETFFNKWMRKKK